MYNPELYWQKRGKNYKHSERNDELQNLKNMMEKYLYKGCKILEVGSGDGRIFSFLLKRKIIDLDSYIMCDFVDSFRNQCLKKNNVLPDKWDGEKLPYNDNIFDLVVSFSVMLHVYPEKIESFLKEHIRVSKKYIFIATWYEEVCKKEQGHCFMHDYYDMFKKMNLEIIDDIDCYMVDSVYRRKNWMLKK